MIVYKVQAQHIDVLWPYAEPLLQKPMKRTLGEIELENINNWLKAEEQQLWLGIDEHKQEIIEIITQLLFYGGYPCTVNALEAAEKAFEEYDGATK